MKIFGIILLIFAVGNFIVMLLSASYGAPSGVIMTKFSEFMLLGTIGGLLVYFGNKKKKNKQ